MGAILLHGVAAGTIMLMVSCGADVSKGLTGIGAGSSLPELAWIPNHLEKVAAEMISRQFAIYILDVDQAQLDKMEARFLPIEKGGREILIVNFYDLDKFPSARGGGAPAVLGGFPFFFSVLLDVESGSVMDSYASPW
jgi:hypothetical protein